MVVEMIKTSKDWLGRKKEKEKKKSERKKGWGVGGNLLCKRSWEERDSRSIMRGKTKVTAPFIP